MCFYLPDNDAQEFINMAYRVCKQSPVSIPVDIPREIVKKVGNEHSLHPLCNRSETLA